MHYIEASQVAALIGRMRPDSDENVNGTGQAATACQWCGASREGTARHFADLPHADDCGLVAFCAQHGLPLPGLPAFDPDATK